MAADEAAEEDAAAEEEEEVSAMCAVCARERNSQREHAGVDDCTVALRSKRTNRSPNATSSRACCGVETTHSVMPRTTGPSSWSSTIRIDPEGFSGEANGDGVPEGVARSGPSEPESKSMSFSL